jgi:glc operon protein GlcG
LILKKETEMPPSWTYLPSIALLVTTVIGQPVAAISAEPNSLSVENITLDAATRVMSSARAFAAASGWPAVIAVTDAAGNLVAMERMDGALVPAGVSVAPGKARTAALFRRSSGDLEKAINGPRPAAATAGEFVMLQGGIPLIEGDVVIGAIGVSTDTPDHDQAIAEAGAKALNEQSRK